MSGVIVSAAMYPDIRAILGVDARTLPDDIIAEDTILGITEALVMKAIPTYATILAAADVAEKMLLRVGTCYLVAIRCAAAFRASIQYGISVSAGGYSESPKTMEWDKVIEYCEARAQEAFMAMTIQLVALGTRSTPLYVSGPTSAGGGPSSFDLWLDKLLPSVQVWVEEGSLVHS
jgi:hypothetical protein